MHRLSKIVSIMKHDMIQRVFALGINPAPVEITTRCRTAWRQPPRINPTHRIVHVPVRARSSQQTKRVRAQVLPGFRVIAPVKTIVKPALRVPPLPLKANWAVRTGERCGLDLSPGAEPRFPHELAGTINELAGGPHLIGDAGVCPAFLVKLCQRAK